jgi:hypothetical protein
MDMKQEQITDILDGKYNVLDSSYGQIAEPCYTKIWCNECGKLIKSYNNRWRRRFE